MRRTLGTGSERGFTLLELMVVMAILVMIAAAFPFAIDRAMPGHRVAAITQRLGSMVRAAQVSSLASGKPVTVRLEGRDRVAADNSFVKDQAIPASVAVSMEDPDGRVIPGLVLYPDGSAQGARIEVNEGDRRGVVVVSALTGRVTVSVGH